MDRFGFDIFCKVVDNFGDIGVCWRLARQLARTSGVKAVRLWVDDLHSFARIEPRLRSEEHTSELHSLMRISYAVFCLKNKIKQHKTQTPIRCNQLKKNKT